MNIHHTRNPAILLSNTVKPTEESGERQPPQTPDARVLRGEIKELSREGVTIKLDSGQQLQAKLLNPDSAQVGLKAEFNVIRQENGTPLLEVREAKTPDSLNARVAETLKSFGVKPHASHVEMAKLLMQNNFPVTKEIFQAFNRAVKLIGTERMEKALFFLENEMQINTENADKLNGYTSRSIQIDRQLNQLVQSISKTENVGLRQAIENAVLGKAAAPPRTDALLKEIAAIVALLPKEATDISANQTQGQQTRTPEPQATQTQGPQARPAEAPATQTQGQQTKPLETPAIQPKNSQVWQQAKPTDIPINQVQGPQAKSSEPPTTQQIQGHQARLVGVPATQTQEQQVRLPEAPVTQTQNSQARQPQPPASQRPETETELPKASPPQTTETPIPNIQDAFAAYRPNLSTGQPQMPAFAEKPSTDPISAVSAITDTKEKSPSNAMQAGIPRHPRHLPGLANAAPKPGAWPINAGNPKMGAAWDQAQAMTGWSSALAEGQSAASGKARQAGPPGSAEAGKTPETGASPLANKSEYDKPIHQWIRENQPAFQGLKELLDTNAPAFGGLKFLIEGSGLTPNGLNKLLQDSAPVTDGLKQYLDMRAPTTRELAKLLDMINGTGQSPKMSETGQNKQTTAAPSYGTAQNQTPSADTSANESQTLAQAVRDDVLTQLGALLQQSGTALSVREALAASPRLRVKISEMIRVKHERATKLLDAMSFDPDEKDVRDLEQFMNDLSGKLSRIKNLAAGDETITKHVEELRDNLSFMSAMKQNVFLQIPLAFPEQKTMGELYVFADKRKKAKKEGEGESALISLDLTALGHFEAYVQKTKQSVRCQFRIENEQVGQLIRKNIRKLSQVLAEHHYSLDYFSFKEITEPFSIADKQPEIDEGAELKEKTYIFDRRM